jgi:transcriptional regulator with XRE-family HTH domain
MGVSLETLADRTGLSYETLRGYENGRRNPTRPSLALVLGNLNPSAADANDVFTGAGFSIDASLLRGGEFARYFFTMAEAADAVERAPWPEFVLDDREQLVAANFAARALWGMPAVRASSPRPHILSVAYERGFAKRVTNWEELARTLASVFKGHPRDPRAEDGGNPSGLRELGTLAAADPAFFATLLQIWVAAEPAPAKARWEYEVHWRDRGGIRIDMLAMVTVASEPDGLSFHDWHPVDSASWTALERIKRRAGRNGGTASKRVRAPRGAAAASATGRRARASSKRRA